MSDSIVDLFKRRLEKRIGPHGLDPTYHTLYVKASQVITKWLTTHGTPKELCAAIRDGLPVLEGALSEVEEGPLDVARWTMRHGLADIRDEDLLIILERVGRRAPRHHVILASGAQWPCPYCQGGHLEWTVAQLRTAIAFLRADNGTPGPPAASG